MKTKRLLLSLSSLLLFAGIGYTQQEAQPRVDFAQRMQSPMAQQAMKTQLKSAFRVFWDGRTSVTAFGLLRDPDIRAAWDVSDEQHQQIEERMAHIGDYLQNNPAYLELEKVGTELLESGNSFTENLDEETMRKVAELQVKMSALTTNYIADTVDNVLTPEQKQTMQESYLASMGEVPIISSGMFEALNLTDAQKQQMERIKKEFEPVFEKYLDDFADNQIFLTKKMFDELAKQGDNREDIQERMQAITKRLMEGDPEYKKVYDEIQSKGKVFATQLKTKMFDVLDDGQWKRLQELINNPPEHTKVLLKIMKEQSGESEEGKNPGGGWQPGPGSWRPGVAIPEAYRQERNTRRNFPRQEN